MPIPVHLRQVRRSFTKLLQLPVLRESSRLTSNVFSAEGPGWGVGGGVGGATEGGGPMWAALALWQSLKHVFLHSESSPLSQESWSCPFRGHNISSPLKLDFKNHFDDFKAG